MIISLPLDQRTQLYPSKSQAFICATFLIHISRSAFGKFLRKVSKNPQAMLCWLLRDTRKESRLWLLIRLPGKFFAQQEEAALISGISTTGLKNTRPPLPTSFILLPGKLTEASSQLLVKIRNLEPLIPELVPLPRRLKPMQVSRLLFRFGLEILRKFWPRDLIKFPLNVMPSSSTESQNNNHLAKRKRIFPLGFSQPDQTSEK